MCSGWDKGGRRNVLMHSRFSFRLDSSRLHVVSFDGRVLD
jgi:hypothetical protein